MKLFVQHQRGPRILGERCVSYHDVQLNLASDASSLVSVDGRGNEYNLPPVTCSKSKPSNEHDVSAGMVTAKVRQLDGREAISCMQALRINPPTNTALRTATELTPKPHRRSHMGTYRCLLAAKPLSAAQDHEEHRHPSSP